MPAGIETFGNQPTATVTAGGTTTSDTAFTVTATDAWPAASSSATPNTFFHIVDAANTSEIMLVTTAPGGSGSGQSWTVVRGAESTAAVSHSANWTAVQVVSAGTLQNFKQASNAVTSAVTVGNSTSELVVATYTPVSLDIEAGASFEAVVFGSIQATTGARPTLQWKLYWGASGSPGSAVSGGTAIATLVTGTGAPQLATTLASGSSFDVSVTATLLSSTSIVANINLWWSQVAGLVSASQTISNGAGVTISGGGPLVLTAKWSAANASNTLTAPAPLFYRAA